jgi:hypothetical protein
MNYETSYAPTMETHVAATLWRDLHQKIATCLNREPLTQEERRLYDALTERLTIDAARHVTSGDSTGPK